MFFPIRATTAAILIAVPLAFATAQTAQDQDHAAHHPGTLPAGPAAPKPSPGGAAAAMPMMDMDKMMSGDMGRMMSMMRMMRMMQGDDGMAMMPADHIEGRIAFYRAELGITDAQLPQWNAFADALRNGAKDMRTAMAAAVQAGRPTTAPAQADAMVQMMSTRLDALKATATTSKALYAVLTDAQKKTADELMAEPPMGMRAMAMGER
jgi:hypothetical protein